MSLQGEKVGRKCGAIDQNLAARALRLVESRQHQMQVDGEAVHHDNLAGLGADKPRAGFAEDFVIAIPRRRALEVSFNAQSRPVIQLLLDQASHGLRLQAKRMSAKVAIGRAVRTNRKMKAIAEMAKRIGGVELPGEFKGWLKRLKHSQNS